jgi:ribosomal protein RSM22 (predicted rRNA methylase)
VEFASAAGASGFHRNRHHIHPEVPGDNESVQLPDPVRRIIEERAEAVGFRALRAAASEMSERYRSAGAGSPLTEAYLVTRMPATYAAAYAVLREVRERVATPIATVLDIGAGTGAASLAARAWFPDAAITMLERDARFAEAARLWLPEAAILNRDVMQVELPPHDLVIAAYSLGELREAIAERLWRAARVALVVIEPGTTEGFARVRGIRRELLDSGARMVAPCPHESTCPMADRDWCHFAARVERSSLHRRLKDGELGYEDEKYSYVALAREAATPAEARVIRRPQHRPGLIELATCTPGGLRTERVAKRDREAFRRARKLIWGDAWSTIS